MMIIDRNVLCVVAKNNSSEEAAKFASIHHIDLHTEHNKNYPLQLVYKDDMVSLFDTETNSEIHVDFLAGALAHRIKYGGGKNQLIGKALGLKHASNPSVLDLTAGLARDAFVIRNLGCTVTMIERSPVLVALIKDGIRRGYVDDQTSQLLKTGFTLIEGEASEALCDIKEKPDVIYIDPMYPERKKSAKVKKDMQILQKLCGHDTDTAEVLNLALQNAGKRVVVKRPRHSEFIGNHKPDNTVESKSTRYDLYYT